MTAAPRCVSCGSPELTPPVGLRASSHDVRVPVLVNDGSWFGKHLDAEVQARICLACGHIAMVATPEAVRWLREHLPSDAQ